MTGLVPRPESAIPVIDPPGEGPGYWAGAPSAVYRDGVFYLAYRLRRPIGQGRGYAVVVARSVDGERFETVLEIGKDVMDAESLERPTLVVTPDGTWRLYLSCATPGTKHWRVELLEAGRPEDLDPLRRRVVLAGDAETGVKDPVIVHQAGRWHLWASCHPLGVPEEADQMVTNYATSPDGVEWTWHGTALNRRPGGWDARGVRVSAVRFDNGSIAAYYDGRADAAQNYEEYTGVAVGTDPVALEAVGSAPAARSPHHGGGLRYLDIVPLPEGRHRIYYEMTRADGAHALVTELR